MLLLQYCSQRLSPRRTVPSALLIAGAAHAAPAADRSFAMDLLLAFVLTTQYRVWDDLADRDRDALIHPDRVTVRTSSLAPLVATCALLGLAGFVIVVFLRESLPAAIAITGLTLVAVSWYSRRGPRSLIGDHVLLAKYPAFVLVVAMSRGGTLTMPLWLSMSAVFLTVVLYEAIHDRSSPGSRQRGVIACEAALLAVTLLALVRRLYPLAARGVW
jgi:hypothetical protein